MSTEALAEANARLADPPDFDPANSARLGLFVVARLAARHGVRVQLRSSPYGGVTAVVLIPGDLVVAEPALAQARPPRQAVAALPAAAGDGLAESRHRELDDVRQRPADRTRRRRPLRATPFAAGAGRHRAEHRTPAAGGGLAGQHRRVQPTAGRAETALPRHARQEIIEADAATDGLPRRVRQTTSLRSCATTLGHRRVARSGDIATPGSATRSPEQLRAMMTVIPSRYDPRPAGTPNGQGAGDPDDRALGKDA